MKQNLRLGVNIDHVATIRNARGGMHPCPIKAALIAQNAGADGITAHLREDRRHISDLDIKEIKENISIPLNLEMAATDEMLEIALKTKPNAACIVPEKRQEITTEGGLDLKKVKNLDYYIKELKKANIRISLFLEPEIEVVNMAHDIGADIIEFHTGKYCHLVEKSSEYEKIRNAAKHAVKLGVEAHAGHGLDYKHAAEIAKIFEIRELNIGHFLIGDAIFIGLENAIKKMKSTIQEVRK